MTLIKYVGYLQLAILVACTVSCRPISQKKMVYGQNFSKEHTKMLREQMRNTFIRDVDVAGTVVDENGKILKDVQLEKRIYDRNGTRLVQEVLKDGTFRAYHENAYEVSLTFLKHGHFRKMLRFMPHSPRNKYPQKYKEVDLDGGRVAIREPNLTVMVENVGLPSPNVMREYRIEGVFNADGKSKGVLFKLNPKNTPEYRKRLPQSYQPLLNKEIEIDLDNIPDDCFYAKFPLTSGGVIEPVSKRIAPSNLSFSYHPSSSPKCITFGISGVGNGFIIPPVKKIDFSSNAGEWQKLMHRQLKDAPKTGYENEVRIFPSEEPGVLCYFKVKNYYGRALLVPPRRFSDNRKSCLWKVRIYLKPDGTTDVRSTEEAWFDHHIKTSSTP